MEAIIIKSIEKEKMDLSNNRFTYDEIITKPINVQSIQKQGGVPISEVNETFEKIRYNLKKIKNPETKEVINYFVKTGDEKLFSDLINVSDIFINEKIEKSIMEFREEFSRFDIPRMKTDYFNMGEQSKISEIRADIEKAIYNSHNPKLNCDCDICRILRPLLNIKSLIIKK